MKKVLLLIMVLSVTGCGIQHREHKFPKSPCACMKIEWGDNNVVQS